jgi:hypothetical protein
MDELSLLSAYVKPLPKSAVEYSLRRDFFTTVMRHLNLISNDKESISQTEFVKANQDYNKFKRDLERIVTENNVEISLEDDWFSLKGKFSFEGEISTKVNLINRGCCYWINIPENSQSKVRFQLNSDIFEEGDIVEVQGNYHTDVNFSGLSRKNVGVKNPLKTKKEEEHLSLIVDGDIYYRYQDAAWLVLQEAIFGDHFYIRDNSKTISRKNLRVYATILCKEKCSSVKNVEITPYGKFPFLIE